MGLWSAVGVHSCTLTSRSLYQVTEGIQRNPELPPTKNWKFLDDFEILEVSQIFLGTVASAPKG